MRTSQENSAIIRRIFRHVEIIRMHRLGDQMDIKDRLLMFVNSLDVKRSEFAKTIEVTPGNLSDWVITGKGSMFILDAEGKLYGEGHKKGIEELTDDTSVFKHKLSPFESRNITLPIYGEIAADKPMNGYDNAPSRYIEIPKAYLSDSEEKYLALKINGNSMPPKIDYGDVVVIKESIDIPLLNGKVCACQTPEGVTLKKLQFDNEKKRIILKPLNPDYDVIIIEDHELERFRILGEMVFLFRVV